MCMAIPAVIKEVKGKRALADFGGVEKEIEIAMTPGVKPDDRVLVYGGFSVEKVTKEKAEAISESLRQAA